jgi:major vault protein
MEERRPPRERELVLAPNEYAYVLDTTKGHINCYVGPNKTSLAQTDQPVMFNALTKRFDATAEISHAVQLFATAPANWYLVLKNPSLAAQGGLQHPKPGVASAMVDLAVGKKVIVPGPVTFALWPGQMARVIEGHRLQTNQYLVIRVYDAQEANKDRAAVLGLDTAPDDLVFAVGDKLIIRGSDVSFYMPPNGAEVVPDASGAYVRAAVTLQRLEYCVLVGEDGKKKTIRGEAVVFPSPDQRFLEENGQRRFRAIELSELTGIHVKVIAPYVDEDGVAHAEGEELFITGKNKIYFPREEHAIVRASGHGEIHHAIAIPAGDGRYVLDRQTGEIALLRGPAMFLADPRREVITRRILNDRECALLYPQNDEALAYNRALRRGAAAAPVAPLKKEGAPAPAFAPSAAAPPATKDAQRDGIDAFARTFSPPRTLTLDVRYDGAVSVDVWSGYAVQVVDRKGGRRVVRGPATVLLAWDETLEALSLSTGTPKSSERLLRTAFLQVSGNQVTDRVEVASSDLVRAELLLKYRVSFEGAAGDERWFLVDNYVKLLCDHAGSLIKAAARQTPIRKLRAEVAEIVRDRVLGKKGADARPGLAFEENGMRVTDVEVLALDIVDDAVNDLLEAAQRAAIKSAVMVAEKESAFLDRQRIEEIDRQLARADHDTRALKVELEAERERRAAELEEQKLQQRAALLKKKREAELVDAEQEGQLKQRRLETRQRELEVDLLEIERKQTLEVALLREQVEAAVRQGAAFSPELIAAVTRLGDAQLLSSLSANFGELAAVEGRGLLETARKFLDFVPQTSLPMLKPTRMAEREGDAE